MSTITESQQTVVAPVKIEPGRLFIDGQWCDSASGETAVTINPATEQEITTVAKATAQDARRARGRLRARLRSPVGRRCAAQSARRCSSGSPT